MRIAAETWPRQRDVPRLGSDIHLWHIDLDSAGSSVPLDACTEGERSRARAFAAARDGKRFLVGRAALRLLLGHYTDRAPESVRLSTGEHGKPFIEAGDHCFNVSHSRGYGVIAVRAEGEVGVDVQHLKPGTDVMGVARAAFAQGEVALLESLTGAARAAMFLRLWTCREAVLKTVGIGLAEQGLELREGRQGVLCVAAQPFCRDPLHLDEFGLAFDMSGAVAWTANEAGASIRHFKA